MSFKLRFALRFTSSVAIILMVCFFSIYILYNGYRQDIYYDRMEVEYHKIEKIILKGKPNDTSISSILERDPYRPELSQGAVLVLDSTGRVLYATDNSNQIHPNPSWVPVIQQRGMQRFDRDERQFIGTFFPKHGVSIWVSASDRIGIEKLKSLEWILIIVFFSALLVTAFIALVFSNEVSKPLMHLGQQMSEISMQDLKKRIPDNSKFKEVNLIASGFNAMLTRVERAFEFQKSFVHHASHELRTPLATMLSHTEAALNNRLTEEEYRTVLSSLKQDQERMIDLTNSLLLISQFEQQGFDERWPELRIDELVYDKISNTMKMFPDLSVSLVFAHTPASDNDLLVTGNEALLKSMLSNLIRNAYHYSINKKVELLLEPGSDYVQLHVNNKGEHLPAEERDQIMIPFFRGQFARQKATGVGLGLTIVQRILEMHKGKLVYTAIGKNINRFTVVLPTSGSLVRSGRGNKKPDQ